MVDLLVNDALENLKIGVIGAGIMGKALIKGMLDSGLMAREAVFAAVNSEASRERVKKELAIATAVGYPKAWIADTDIYLICTKPYRVPKVLKQLSASGVLKSGALIISVAAGVTLATMESLLPEHPILRAMPNTPCLIQAGATVVSPGQHARPEHVALGTRIFASVGKCLELHERHLNAVTAVSGSGPAYIYLIMEALADGAVKVGLPRDVAFLLVSQTMLGAAQMMQRSGRHPATLKDDVTTPSGCTISALLTLEDGKIRSTLARAVEEATRIAASLG